MGRFAGGRLAAAVSAADGLGILGGGYGDEQWLEREFSIAQNARIGCGFITWSLARKPHLLGLVLAHSPVAIMLSFGAPGPFAAQIKQAGAKLICQVQTLAHAREAIDAGADVLVAQGAEAGGHAWERATVTLVPELADYLAGTTADVALVAAGGIADGRGLAAMLMLGADGVLVGTRFLASVEALIPRSFQEAIIHAEGDSTVRTFVPDIARRYEWPAPFPARVLKSQFVMEWHGREDALKDPATLREQEARFWQGFNTGDVENTCVLAGEAVGLIRDIQPAGDIVRTMVSKAESVLAGRMQN